MNLRRDHKAPPLAENYWQLMSAEGKVSFLHWSEVFFTGQAPCPEEDGQHKKNSMAFWEGFWSYNDLDIFFLSLKVFCFHIMVSSFVFLWEVSACGCLCFCITMCLLSFSLGCFSSISFILFWFV